MSERILDALQEMADAFPRDGIKTPTFRVYLKRLSHYPEPAVLAAIDVAINSRKFFPTIGELTDIIGELANGPDDLAETAWIEVVREVKRVGYQPNRVFQGGEWYDPPKPRFSTDRIAEAVASVGWKNICLNDVDEARTAFVFTYRNLRKRDTSKIQRGEIGPADAALPDAPVRAIGKGRVA